MAALEVQHAREAERSRIARDLHDDLGASLTEISMLASVTAEETAAAPVRGLLEEIAGKAHTVVGALDEIVWAVNPRHDTLASLADYLAAFAGEFLGAAGVTLRLELPRGVPASEVDTERRHALLLAVREALNNVVKHSGAREVRLRFFLPTGAIVVEVEDNGKGFDTALVREGEGIGNLHSRLAALGGACEITSTLGSGTKVALRLPLAIG
jgi:signal transduction histidine kinase